MTQLGMELEEHSVIRLELLLDWTENKPVALDLT